jgi:hypothetical protein
MESVVVGPGRAGVAEPSIGHVGMLRHGSIDCVDRA